MEANPSSQRRCTRVLARMGRGSRAGHQGGYQHAALGRDTARLRLGIELDKPGPRVKVLVTLPSGAREARANWELLRAYHRRSRARAKYARAEDGRMTCPRLRGVLAGQAGSRMRYRSPSTPRSTPTPGAASTAVSSGRRDRPRCSHCEQSDQPERLRTQVDPASECSRALDLRCRRARLSRAGLRGRIVSQSSTQPTPQTVPHGAHVPERRILPLYLSSFQTTAKPANPLCPGRGHYGSCRGPMRSRPTGAEDVVNSLKQLWIRAANIALDILAGER